MTEQEKYLIIKFNNEEEHQYISNNNKIYYIGNMPEKKIILCDYLSIGNFTYEDNTKILNTEISINQKEYNKTFKIDI